MKKVLQLQVDPEVAVSIKQLEETIRQQLGVSGEVVIDFRITRRSIDARGRKVRVNLSVEVAVNDALPSDKIHFDFVDF